MENFKINDIPEMQDETLQELVLKLKEVYKSTQYNFAVTCYYVWRIVEYYKNTKMYLQDKKDYWYSATTLLEKFGLDKTSVSRLHNSYIRFCFSTLDGQDIKLLEQFELYSPSKLYELLPLTDDAIEQCLEMQVIKSDMTVKEIRKQVKLLINGESVEKLANPNLKQTEEIEESEIPLAYDPTKEYDFEYYKSKSKNQLLNMIWDLQKAYIKLKNTRK